LVRISAGITTGALAIVAAQPTDVVKVRMQAEVRAAEAKPRYSGVMNAYATIGREEGLRGLYKGQPHTIDYRVTIETCPLVLTRQTSFMCAGSLIGLLTLRETG
jgi:solute carrier family 25 uncoupling protein 8/9